MPLQKEPTATDAQLIAASLKGRIGAFGQLIERYQNLVCSIAYAATADRALSEDVGQETFVAAWTKLAELSEPDKLRGWLCGTARNLSKMALRKRKRQVVSGDVEKRMGGSKASALDKVIADEEEEIVAQALGELPENYREPLVLFYREEQSVKQVATGLGLSEDVVKQRLSRGRESLREGVGNLLEGAFRRNRPGKAFAVGVLALLAAQTGAGVAAAAGAKAAGAKAVAESAAVKSKWVGPAMAFAALALVAVVVVAFVWSAQKRAEEAASTKGAVSTQEPEQSEPVAEPVETEQRSGPRAGDTRRLDESVDPSFDPANPTVIVKVVDLLGGAIPGAAVTESMIPEPSIELGRTDHNGLLQVSSSLLQTKLPRDLLVKADGYTRGTTTISGYGRHTISLIPESTISGTVISAAGEPLSGMQVTAKGLDQVTSGSNGGFTLVGARPGRYRLSAYGPGWAGALAEPVDLGLHNNETGVEIRVAPAFSVSGLVSRGGQSPAGFFVHGGRKPVAVDESGRFRIDGVSPGKHWFRVEPTYRRQIFETKTGLEVVVDDRDVTDMTLQVTTQSVHVHATLDDGSAAAGLRFSGYQPGAPSSFTCMTDVDGRCMISGLRPGHLRGLDPLLPGVEPQHVATGETAEFVIPPISSIAGRLLDSDGSPLPAQIVKIAIADADDGDDGATARTGILTLTDDDGRFLLSPLGAATYRIKVSEFTVSSAGSSFQSNPVSIAEKLVRVKSGELVSGVEIRASVAQAEIRGQVVDGFGNPSAETLVSYSLDSENLILGSGLPKGIQTTLTNEAGEFTFTKVVAAKRYRLFALGQSGEQARLSSVFAGAKLVELTVHRPAALTLTISGLMRKYDKVNIEAVHNDGTTDRTATILFDLDAPIKTIVGLKPGRWTVTVRVRPKREATTTVVLRAGEATAATVSL